MNSDADKNTHIHAPMNLIACTHTYIHSLNTCHHCDSTLLLNPTHLSISEPISSMKTPKSSITVFSNSSLSSQFGVSSYKKARMNDVRSSISWWRRLRRDWKKSYCKKKFVIRPRNSACNFDSVFDKAIKWNTISSQTTQTLSLWELYPLAMVIDQSTPVHMFRILVLGV